jgi:hypothetical protein
MMGGACSTHGPDERCIQNFSRKTEGKGHSEDLGVDGRIILEWILEKWGGKMWTECIWLRMGSSGGLL